MEEDKEEERLSFHGSQEQNEKGRARGKQYVPFKTLLSYLLSSPRLVMVNLWRMCHQNGCVTLKALKDSVSLM